MMKYILTGFLCLFLTQTQGQEKEVFATNDGAIRGYDPVAYFDQSKPLKGNKSYHYKWKGAIWYFTNEGNLNKFKSDPEAYAPQFGGYCAYAVAKGSTATTDPEAWTIVDGKLYLNYSKAVQKKWRANQDELIAKGHKNWPGVLK